MIDFRWVLWGALVGAACGDSPSAPGPGPTPTPGAVTISGQIVTTVGGVPVPGAQIDAGSVSARADNSGRFELSGVQPVTAVTISAAGHVTRRTSVSASSSTIDVVAEDGLWNLDFYRELVRNGAGGGNLEPLNPWTVEPSFYIDRRPESGSDREIPDESVALVETAIGQVVPLLTNGRFRGSRIEIGTDPPADHTDGTVVVRWDPVEIAASSGAAAGITRGVGGNASVVVLRTIEQTQAIYHELGHVLGLYHPLGSLRPSLMAGPGTAAAPHFTDWDVFHTSVLYARPPGNTDIDNDPPGFVTARSKRTLTIACPWPRFSSRTLLVGLAAEPPAADDLE